MPSDPLVAAFEAATIDAATFHQCEHLYVAWRYLRAMPLEDALARYVAHLRRLVAALGAPQKYHATITWAYLVLLNDAIDRCPDGGFDELLARNPALADPVSGALLAYYDRAVLDSEDARARFVLPRRA